MKTYVIGGVPRSGKSSILKLMLTNYNIQCLSTDLLREGLILGVPESGMSDNLNENQKSELLWPYLRGILLARKYFNDHLLIEGTNFIPNKLTEFKDHPDIKICFVGFGEINAQEKLKHIRQNRSENNWTDDLTDKELLVTIEGWISRSKSLKAECGQYNLKYFDTSKDFDNQLQVVVDYLID